MQTPSTQRFAVLCYSLLFAIAFLGLPARAVAQCEVQKLIASDASSGDRFASSVSINGDVAVIGAPGHDCIAGFDCGAAYIFRLVGSTWVEEQKLSALDTDWWDAFGTSVSCSGNVVVVGAWAHDCPDGIRCGAAYVYRFDGSRWIQEQKLRVPEPRSEDRLGERVFISQDLALLRASSGVHIYRFDGKQWAHEQTLTAPDAVERPGFGVSLFARQNLAVLGSLFARCDAGPGCGRAYFYHYNGSTWIQEQALIPSDAGAEDRFGSAVSVAGDVSVIGAYGQDCAGRDYCGAAYVYRLHGSIWIEEQKLTASDPYWLDSFGTSVATEETVVLVGAHRDDCAVGSECGAAYLYQFDGSSWIEERKVHASDVARYDEFGWSVGISAGTALIGASRKACPAGDGCGAAYIFALGPDCNDNGQADFCDIRDGGIPDVDQDGVPDECEPVALDIRPGACPNPLNPRSRGVLPVAVVGSDIFDVTEIDVESLVLTRADGVGGSVRPLSHRHGPRVKVKDVATPFSGPLCDCHELRGDGIDDLGMKFSTRKLVRNLELESLSVGTEVPLTVSGTLRDGTPFEASDCILITGGSRNGEADAADGWPTSSESGWPTSSEVGESIPRSLRRSQD